MRNTIIFLHIPRTGGTTFRDILERYYHSRNVIEIKNFINTDISFSGNIKKRLNYANKIKSKFAVIIGEEEANQNAALVKNLDTGKQIKIKFNELSKYLKKILQLK